MMKYIENCNRDRCVLLDTVEIVECKPKSIWKLIVNGDIKHPFYECKSKEPIQKVYDDIVSDLASDNITCIRSKSYLIK